MPANILRLLLFCKPVSSRWHLRRRSSLLYLRRPQRRTATNLSSQVGLGVRLGWPTLVALYSSAEFEPSTSRSSVTRSRVLIQFGRGPFGPIRRHTSGGIRNIITVHNYSTLVLKPRKADVNLYSYFLNTWRVRSRCQAACQVSWYNMKNVDFSRFVLNGRAISRGGQLSSMEALSVYLPGRMGAN